MTDDNTTNTLIARPGQTLHDHLVNVAGLTEAFADRFGAGPWGNACGLLHDIGKASAKFQRRVRGENLQVDHSTAGARLAASTWGGVGKLLAYCLAGHHTGLPDGRANDGRSLKHRLDPKLHHIEDCSRWKDCLGPDTQPASPGFADCPFSTVPKGLSFRLAFFQRMVFSCLVDADRLDAEAAGDEASHARASRREDIPPSARCAPALTCFLCARRPLPRTPRSTAPAQRCWPSAKRLRN